MICYSFSNRTDELPIVSLKVNGVDYSFLIDTGATCSSISAKFYEGPITNHTMRSVGVSGTEVICHMTPAIEVKAINHLPFFHKFVVTPNSPLNLLGRDLMHKLNIEIVFSDSSVNFSLLSDVQDATVELMPHFMSKDEPQQVKYNIAEVNPSLWSQYKDESGFVGIPPYKAKLITQKPVYMKQYPLSPEKVEGIQPVIDNFLKQGVIVPTHSPYNTPINPIRKADGTSWRLTQDLRAINSLIIPLAPIVPDVPTILNSIPHIHTHFTVVDLCAAFFSIPVHADTQPLFAFTFKGAQLTWTRLAQGFVDSPAVFSAAVKRLLDTITDLPSTVCVLQYTDDILISAETEADCLQASIVVCNVLASVGFKASNDKLQWVQSKVHYLGHIISPGQKDISAERVQLIKTIRTPENVTQLQSFLGLVNYCRAWIPDCAYHDRNLRCLIQHGMGPRDSLKWTSEAEENFNALKIAITCDPALGLPDYSKPFHLYAGEAMGVAMAVLTQEHGGKPRPVSYLSRQLDPIVHGMPACLRAVAAAAEMVRMAEKIVLSHPLILYTTHQVGVILHNLKTQHMTAQRRSGYEATLLATENLTIKPTSVSSPAIQSLFGLSTLITETVPHDCMNEIERSTAARVDLKDTPLDGGEHLYIDGSCSRPSDGVYLCGYAIVTLEGERVEAYRLNHNSAQAAEIIALSRACELTKGKRATIYTDSKYGYGVVQDFAQTWARRNFKTSEAKPISHAELVGDLLQAVMLPSELAVVKVKGHVSGDETDAVGNRNADELAKWAAEHAEFSPYQRVQSRDVETMMFAHVSCVPDIDLKILQSQPTQGDVKHWAENGCAPDADGLIRDKNGRIALPKLSLVILIRHYHGISHNSASKVTQMINRLYCIQDTAKMVKLIVFSCLICAKTNPHRKTPHDALPFPEAPFQCLQIDFSHMPPVGNLKYILTIVDRFSKWPEVFACAKEDAKTVVKILSKEVISRYGIPMTIESDNGTPFTSKVTKLLAKALAINWHYYIPYHPQSSGVVERTHRKIKDKITKACMETSRKGQMCYQPYWQK
ncbi:Retrovirus-related Pol polyprotein from transposon gypsy [Triplophysa tibetana]|uniref:ribonuclease H n=1 Tax=Triplophysa tibetana TaxID=1572043 RepID=A0A5A9PPC7_9TELE|nr:Retrovirus-related Pol polyprotein from transposon gypsy [Triplophysa tibetana]